MQQIGPFDFPYTPLNTSTPTIRLLHLSRTSTGTIAGNIKPFPLNNPTTHFNAISYVWGPKIYSHTININNHPFPILDNLYRILELICDDEQLRECWWWIDYICINQGTGLEVEKERNSQVAMMKEIYQSAEMVLGWLGGGEDDGEEAMRFLHVLRKHRDRLDAQKDLARLERILGAELKDRGRWKAVEKLFLRPWWSRVWTLQEYIVPWNFKFYCGKESIDRDGLKVAVYGIRLAMGIDPSLMAKRAYDRAWNRRRLLMWYRERLPMHLLGLMAYVGDYKFTNPRDRIYSVLGMVNDGSLVGQPRYGDDVGKVYTDLVKSFVENYKSLDVICLADRFNWDKVKKDDAKSRLPTWCPDWRAEDSPWVMPAMACQGFGGIGNLRPTKSLFNKEEPLTFAAGIDGTRLRIQFSDDGKTLSCRGIHLDQVDGLGGLKVVRHNEEQGIDQEEVYECFQAGMGDNASFSSSGTMDMPSTIQETRKKKELRTETASLIMWDMMRCLMLDRKDRYLAQRLNGGYSHVHFRDMCLAALQTPEQVDPLFLDWFRLNRHFRIEGSSLEELCKKSEDSPPSFNGGLADRESFLSRFKDTTHYMGKRLMTTRDGHSGMGPCRAQKGDQIWILLGCSIPMILRRRDEDVFEVVGECYLCGFMNGEVFRLLGSNPQTQLKVQEIRLG